MTTKREVLREIVSAGGRVDAEAGVLRGVKILGAVSRNGRRYLPEAMRGAVGMYEGRQVNLDHDTQRGAERSIRDRIGWLESVRFADGSLRGDLHLLLSDPQAAKVLEVAEKRPDQIGLSHHAEGRTRREGDETLVEEILKVFSVDVVGQPATSGGLFEQADATPADNAPAVRNEEFATTVQELLNRTDWGPGELFAAVAKLVDQERKAAEAPAPLPTEPAAPTSESHRGSGAFPSGLAFAEAVTGDSAPARPAARPVRRLAEAAHCGPVPHGENFVFEVTGQYPETPSGAAGGVPRGSSFVSEITGDGVTPSRPDQADEDAARRTAAFVRAITEDGDWTPQPGFPRGQRFADALTE